MGQSTILFRPFGSVEEARRRLRRAFSAERFFAFSFGGGEAAVFLAPPVDGLLGDVILSGGGGNRGARGFGFGEDFDDLVNGGAVLVHD